MGYPDFIVSKVVPGPLGTPRIKQYIAVLEIKNCSEPLTPIRNRTVYLKNCINQLIRYCARIGMMPNAQVPDGEPFQAYLVFGSLYTRLEFVHPVGGNGPVLAAQPWQPVFQQLGANTVDTAPFTYRMCELAHRYWNLWYIEISLIYHQLFACHMSAPLVNSQPLSTASGFTLLSS